MQRSRGPPPYPSPQHQHQQLNADAQQAGQQSRGGGGRLMQALYSPSLPPGQPHHLHARQQQQSAGAGGQQAGQQQSRQVLQHKYAPAWQQQGQQSLAGPTPPLSLAPVNTGGLISPTFSQPAGLASTPFNQPNFPQPNLAYSQPLQLMPFQQQQSLIPRAHLLPFPPPPQGQTEFCPPFMCPPFMLEQQFHAQQLEQWLQYNQQQAWHHQHQGYLARQARGRGRGGSSRGRGENRSTVSRMVIITGGVQQQSPHREMQQQPPSNTRQDSARPLTDKQQQQRRSKVSLPLNEGRAICVRSLLPRETQPVHTPVGGTRPAALQQPHAQQQPQAQQPLERQAQPPEQQEQSSTHSSSSSEQLSPHSQVLEVIKSNEPGAWSRLQLRQCESIVLRLATEMFGSHFLIQKLKSLSASKEDMQLVLSELTPKLPSLVLDPISCELVCLLLERGSMEQQRVIVARALTHVSGQALFLSQHPLGSHLIALAIRVVAPAERAAIVADLEGHIAMLARHKLGTRVILAIIQFAPAESCREACIAELAVEVLPLSVDSIGHLVIKMILEKGGQPSDRKQLCTAIAPSVLYLTTHPYASHVVQVCFQFSDSDSKKHLLLYMLAAHINHSGEDPLQQLHANPYGKQVLDTALTACSDLQVGQLLRRRLRVAHPTDDTEEGFSFTHISSPSETTPNRGLLNKADTGSITRSPTFTPPQTLLSSGQMTAREAAEARSLALGAMHLLNSSGSKSMISSAEAAQRFGCSSSRSAPQHGVASSSTPFGTTSTAASIFLPPPICALTMQDLQVSQALASRLPRAVAYSPTLRGSLASRFEAAADPGQRGPPAPLSSPADDLPACGHSPPSITPIMSPLHMSYEGESGSSSTSTHHTTSSSTSTAFEAHVTHSTPVSPPQHSPSTPQNTPLAPVTLSLTPPDSDSPAHDTHSPPVALQAPSDTVSPAASTLHSNDTAASTAAAVTFTPESEPLISSAVTVAATADTPISTATLHSNDNTATQTAAADITLTADSLPRSTAPIVSVSPADSTPTTAPHSNDATTPTATADTTPTAADSLEVVCSSATPAVSTPTTASHSNDTATQTSTADTSTAESEPLMTAKVETEPLPAATEALTGETEPLPAAAVPTVQTQPLPAATATLTEAKTASALGLLQPPFVLAVLTNFCTVHIQIANTAQLACYRRQAEFQLPSTLFKHPHRINTDGASALLFLNVETRCLEDLFQITAYHQTEQIVSCTHRYTFPSTPISEVHQLLCQAGVDLLKSAGSPALTVPLRAKVSNADFARALLWQLVVVPDLKEALHLHEKGRDDEGPTELVQQPAFSEWKAASDR